MAKYEFTCPQRLNVVDVATFEDDPNARGRVFRFATDDADVAATVRQVDGVTQVSGPEPKGSSRKDVKPDGDN